MNRLIDATHDPALRSWVESANAPDSDFPVQNLPYGAFRRIIETPVIGCSSRRRGPNR